MKHNPKDIQKSASMISRRAMVLGLAQVGLIGGLGARMRYLQVNEAEKFRFLAEENRINVRLLPPSRGLIFDRKGRPVALNSPNYRVVMIRENTADVDQVLADLQQLIYIDPLDMEKAYKELYRRSAFVPVTIIENLPWADFAKVSANTPALPGIITEVGLSRVYPQKETLAHVVGYVGPVSDYDLGKIENPDPLLRIPRFQIGKFGIEAKLEIPLRGAAGNQQIEVNARGRVMRELDRTEGQTGETMQITVDSALQDYAIKRMEGLSASTVVIDCETGDMLACASAPSFDPNLFVRGISSKTFKELNDDIFGPLRGKAVQGTYAPASTFKMITALAALEDGQLKPNERVSCGGSIVVSRNRFHCWKRRGHGRMDLQQSLMQSCDVYYYTVAQRVGIDKISEMAVKFGLGVKHNIPLNAVRTGVAPTRDWKKASFDEQWYRGDTVNAAIGQGYVLASPLQLAIMAARLGTGREIHPRLVHSIDGKIQPYDADKPLDIDPNNLALIQKAMFGVSNTPGGTGYRSRIVAEDMKMSGKTGTAQVSRITAAERAKGVRKCEDKNWKLRDHALFVSYAPHDNPKVAIAVIVEHGCGGSKAAAPIARDVTLFALKGKVPDVADYPKEQHKKILAEQEELLPRLRDFDAPDSDGTVDQA